MSAKNHRCHDVRDTHWDCSLFWDLFCGRYKENLELFGVPRQVHSAHLGGPRSPPAVKLDQSKQHTEDDFLAPKVITQNHPDLNRKTETFCKS